VDFAPQNLTNQTTKSLSNVALHSLTGIPLLNADAMVKIYNQKYKGATLDLKNLRTWVRKTRNQKFEIYF
jgi:hypothetical protein